MPVQPGTRIGPYEITAAIGAGGMGEVYRATDTNLGRQVAVKVLPDAVAQDAERLARFDREARTLAALNHPNIAQVYGLEKAHGTVALVMELVEGADLSQQIASGPLPMSAALAIAHQILDALEAAHAQGIIHRDLKPANVKVRDDGTVKVLDFGLAKALDPVVASGASPASVSMSPTITTPAMTQMGMILGTAAYMSPEQARGRPADKRADIWAFGCVLYEMLSGRRAFEGDDVSTTLARVLEREPQVDHLPRGVPPRVLATLGRCLQKDPRQRLHDTADVRLALDGAFETTTGGPDVQTKPRGWQYPVPVLVTVLLALAAAIAVWWLKPTPDPAPGMVARFAAGFEGRQAPTGVARFTADGSGLVYVGAGPTAGTSQLWIRRWANLDAQPIAGTDGAATFALSPDNREVAFAAIGGPLRVTSLAGAPVRTIVDRIAAVWAWSPGGDLWFTALDPNVLSRVPAAGGAPESVTDLADNEALHGYLTLLPGTAMAVFDVRRATTAREAMLWTIDLESHERRPLVAGQSPRYVPTGHLLFASAEGTLMAAPIDPQTAELTGPAVPVIEGLSFVGAGSVNYATSEQGALFYAAGAPSLGRTLVRVDRNKRETPLGLPPGEFNYPRLSPDGTRVALTSLDPFDVFVWDRRTDRLTNVTASPAFETYALWTPDGNQLIVSSAPGDNQDQRLYLFPADGNGTAVPLTDDAPGQAYAPNAVSPDGSRLIFRRGMPNQDLSVLSLDDPRDVQTVLATEATERNAELSPDGRWLAYESDVSGATEIYVSPFPDAATRRWQVSTAGGERPVWSRDSGELFYIGGAQLMAARVYTEQGTFSSDPPAALFDLSVYDTGGGGRPGRTYDVDGDGFLFLKRVEPSDPESRRREFIVLNWFEELKPLVPTTH